MCALKMTSSLIGSCQNCYLGFSNSNQIRYNSSSGGVVREILIYLFKKKSIQGALIVKSSHQDPFYFYSDIATTIGEIERMPGSVYAPVDYAPGIKKILKNEGKYAIVGIPCQINSVRTLMERDKQFREKIFLTIGLFCNGTPSIEGTKFFCDRYNIDKNKVKSIRYRSEGWPGSMKIETDNKTYAFSKRPSLKNIKLRTVASVAFSSFFYLEKCLSCFDKLNKLADISTGDAWLPELRGDRIGVNVIISRSKLAEDVLLKMKEEKIITLKKTPLSKIIDSQGGKKIKNRLFSERLESNNTKADSTAAGARETLRVKLLKRIRKMSFNKIWPLLIFLKFIQDYVIYSPAYIIKILKSKFVKN